MKTCSKCGAHKTMNEFPRRADSKDGYRSWCKECEKQRMAAYHRANRERIAEQRREYYKANCESIKQSVREYRESNPDKVADQKRRYRETHEEEIKEYQRQYYLDNKERLNEQSKNYYQEHKDRALALAEKWRLEHEDHCKQYQRQYYTANRAERIAHVQEWRKANPEKRAVQEHKRRARLLEADGSFTGEEWQDALDFYDNACLACGTTDDLTIDHVIPLARGGSNLIDNLQPLCQSCNSSKGVKLTDYRIEYVVTHKYSHF